MRIEDVALSQIKSNREKRQRRELTNIEDLAESINKIGLINPITVTDDYVLVAGERRLAAVRMLQWPTIPVNFLSDLSEADRQTIELEENIKRETLPWPDQAAAILKLAQLLSHDQENLDIQTTAERLHFKSPAHVGRNIILAKAIEESPALAKYPTLRSAYTQLGIQSKRETDSLLEHLTVDNLVDEITDTSTSLEKVLFTEEEERQVIDTDLLSDRYQIVNADFTEWAPTYNGEKFNFIHCDFPYGVNQHRSKQANSEAKETYEDTEDIFWTLCETLGSNFDRLVANSSHIMFWFSFKHYAEMLRRFPQLFPDVRWFPFPLIWFKSDLSGLMPDHTRQPLRVYETALIGSTYDRRLVKAKPNCVPMHYNKRARVHPSEKPIEMLQEFFPMFVDEHTTMLDPTCGSASALKTALKLGAKRIVGIEMDERWTADGTS